MKIQLNLLPKNYTYKNMAKGNNFKPYYNHSLNSDCFVKNNINFTSDEFDEIYSIDSDGNIQKFKNIKEASVKTNTAEKLISNILCGVVSKSKNNVTFIEARFFETEDEYGNKKPNGKLMKNILKELNSSSVYVVDLDGKYKKYNSQTAASEEVGLSKTSFYQSANGFHRTGDLFYIKANELEKYNNDGTITVNTDLIKELITDSTFYAVDKDGNISKFKSRKDASEKLNIGLTTLNHALCSNYIASHVGEYAFICANDIEITDKDGNVTLNPSVLNKAIESFRKNYVYALDIGSKTLTLYEDRKNVLQEFGIDSNQLSKYIKNKSVYENIIFINANEIENIDEYANAVVDVEKVNKILNNAIKEIPDQTVYSIDVNGNITKFKDIKEASEKIQAPVASISRSCVQHCSVHGYKFFKNIKQANQIQDEIIYAIDKDGNFKKFFTMPQAMKELNISQHGNFSYIDEDGIPRIIKKYVFKRAKSVEIVNKDGTRKINQQAIDKIVNHFKHIGVWVIKDDEAKFYNTIQETVVNLRIPAENIMDAICNNTKINGYSIYSPRQFEEIILNQ